MRTLLKRGAASNELTRFRFDAILSKHGTDGEPPVTVRSDWHKDGLTAGRVREVLAATAPDSLLITSVPIGRLADDLATLAWLDSDGDERAGDWSAARAPFAGESAEALWNLEADLPVPRRARGRCQRPTAGATYWCWRRGTRAPLAALRAAPPSDARGWAATATTRCTERSRGGSCPRCARTWKRSCRRYMVPPTFVVLRAMPLTPNGKVDRRALPQAEAVRPDDAGCFVAPRTPTEETLAQIWSDLLGLEQISAHDNFFDLGGHSLKATQLTTRVRDAFGIELSLRQVFKTPALDTLATVIEGLIEAEVDALSEDDAARLADEAETGV